MGVSDKVKGYIELLRPHNLLVSIITTMIGYGAVIKALSMEVNCLNCLVALVIVALVAAAGYVINDYYDVEADAVSKPWRPIVRGAVSRTSARIMAYFLFSLGLFISLFYGVYLELFTLISAVLVHEYSRWIKKTGFVGNVAVALESAATILFGGFFASVAGRCYIPYIVFVPALYAFLMVLGREIVKGIEDVQGDARVGTITLAVALGPRKAAVIASLLLLIVVAISPLPWIMGLYNLVYLILAIGVDATIVYSIVLLLSQPNNGELIASSRKARSVLKIGFLLGGLAFLLGLL